MTSAGFGGNGGGIANVNSGELLISQSSITNNRTGNGGNALGSQEAGAGGNGAGISHSGNILAINTSTISYNETGTRGIGAGTNDAVGGGIFDGGETSFSIVNSTVSHNIASNIGGGIFSNPYVSASITIDHVTFGFNTNYALYSGSASAILRNSAFWGNVENGIVSDCVFDVDTTNSINNVFEQSGSPCGLANGVNNNITGGDTDLAPLADNGGLTHTHALLPSSQAIGHVPSSTQISDQRRVFRSLDADNQPPYNFNSDAGALEQIVITPITVNSSALGFEILTNEQGHLWEVFLNVGDRIKFEVLFTHATGDLLAQLLSKDLQTLWQFSNTSTDNEIIDFVATERGSYWIDVQGVSAATNTFDVVIELIRSDICFPVTTPGTVAIVCL